MFDEIPTVNAPPSVAVLKAEVEESFRAHAKRCKHCKCESTEFPCPLCGNEESEPADAPLSMPPPARLSPMDADMTLDQPPEESILEQEKFLRGSAQQRTRKEDVRATLPERPKDENSDLGAKHLNAMPARELAENILSGCVTIDDIVRRVTLEIQQRDKAWFSRLRNASTTAEMVNGTLTLVSEKLERNDVEGAKKAIKGR